jgi:hypothetical protein
MIKAGKIEVCDDDRKMAPSKKSSENAAKAYTSSSAPSSFEDDDDRKMAPSKKSSENGD